MQNNLLFVYGTLLHKDNEFAHYLTTNSTFFADGRFKGLLFDAGDYPAAIADQQTGQFVFGKIYLLNNAEILPALDDYEGIGDVYPHEYVRQAVEIETDQGTETCWVYLYNWPVEGLTPISSGRY